MESTIKRLSKTILTCQYNYELGFSIKLEGFLLIDFMIELSFIYKKGLT